MDQNDSAEAREIRALVLELVEEFDVPFAFVCEPVAEDPSRARTVAFWIDGEFVPEEQYEVAETPGARVRMQGSLYHSGDVRVIYPRDASLRERNAESYLGVAITSEDGEYLGHVGVMDRRPLEEPALAETKIRNVARRMRELFQLHGG